MRRLLAAFLLILPAAAPARAAERDQLEDTLSMLREVAEVAAASRRAQPVREAPSAVTVVTAEEIRAFGYRTLAEVLAHCRGFFITYDRNYTYLGSRGFARTGDYNARVLVLLNGQRLNDNVYGAMLPGNDFLVDLDAVSRVEIIRGPGSALYGSNSLFGVINVVTREAAEARGLVVGAEGRSFGSSETSFTYGSPAGAPTQIAASGSAFLSRGQNLHFPEFDGAGLGDGMASGADGERSRRALLTVRRGNLAFQAGWVDRLKEVPSASFDTLFDDGREKTVDGEALVGAAYQRPFGSGHRLELTAAYDRIWYWGDYPYDRPPVLINKDVGRGEWLSAGALAHLRAGPSTRLTLGFESVLNLRVHQKNYDLGTNNVFFDEDHPFTASSVFAEAERRFGERVLISAGARYDYGTRIDIRSDSLNPRLAVVFLPGAATTLKYLAGRAFRAPNAYELYYDLPGLQQGDGSLLEESIVTHELVLDQALGGDAEGTFSVYSYRLKNLIEQVIEPGTGILLNRNTEDVRSTGLEAEIRFRVRLGLTGFASATYNSSERDGSGQVAGSPRATGNLGVIFSLAGNRLDLAPALRYVGAQRSLTGTRLGSYAVADLTLSSRRPWRGVALSASVYNLADRRYGDVVGPEFIQEMIRQDGRNYRLSARWAF